MRRASTICRVKPLSKLVLIAAISLLIAPGCAAERSATTSTPEILGVPNIGWQRDLRVEGVAYDLYRPENYTGMVVLVLPGWNYSRSDWPTKNPQLLDLAEEYGAVLVLPDMLVSIYETAYYEQTTRRWHPRHPGTLYLRDYFIPAMQKRHNLFNEKTFNTLLGLSTGGRGVAMVALELPDLFSAGSALSGDFDQSISPRDRLMTAVYGPYGENRELWEGRDNPSKRAAEWKMPLYLAHGSGDRIVGERHSAHFYRQLTEALGSERIEEIPVVYDRIDGAGHDYQFWGDQLTPSFRFFDSIRRCGAAPCETRTSRSESQAGQQ